jgi:uncharacterized protein
MNNKEIYFFASPLLLESNGSSPGKVSGTFAKYNQPSSDRGGFKERFAPTAFSNLKPGATNIFARLDHSDNPLHQLARTDNGSLVLNSNENGGTFEFSLPDTSVGRDVAALVNSKMLNAMSFGYAPDKFEWNSDKNNPIRTHTSGTLTEISLVFEPAFDHTSVELHCKGEPSAQAIEEFNNHMKSFETEVVEPVDYDIYERELALSNAKARIQGGQSV